MTPARYLRLLRARRGVSQMALGLAIGSDHKTISEIERSLCRLHAWRAREIGRELRDGGVLERLVAGEAVRICDDCGCHDFDACMGTHAMPCHWPGPTPAEGPDRCSACAEIAAGEGRAAA